MKSVSTFGYHVDGKLHYTKAGQFKEAVTANFDSNERFLVTYSKIFKKRSIEQNAYLHGYIFPEVLKGMIDIGYSPSEVDEATVKMYLKDKFLRRDVVNEKTGEVISIVRNTSELSTVEFMQFVDDIIKWAAEYLDIELMLPNEQAMMDFNKINT